MTDWAFETRQVHSGAVPDPTTGARAVPIHPATSYVFRDTAHAAAAFELADLTTHAYTRLSNPTTAAAEERIASLEGGSAAVAVASGQAATTLALLNLARAGDHIVASSSLYGGTRTLLEHTFADLGIEVTFVDDPDDLGASLVAGLGSEAGWRCCLLLSSPCAVLTLTLAARWLPPPRRTARDSRLDVLGLGLLCGCTLTLMVPFIRPPGSGGEALVWGTMVCALAAVFVVHQGLRVRRGRHPLVHPALTSWKPYMLGTAVAMAQFGSSLAAFLVLTVFLQDGLGLSALLTAAVTLPGAVGMGISSALAWRLVRRIGPRTVTVGLAPGIGASLAGAVVTLGVPTAVLPMALAATQLMSGVAGGLTVSPNQTQVLQHAPPEAAGVGGGILQMAQRIAAAVCLSAVPAVYLHTASGPPGGSHPRAGYALASCVCAGLLAVALLLSLLRQAATPPRPSVLAPPNHAGVVPRPKETT
ncbi:MFS transporter [Streptomyces hygroscopicus]|uniref:MFS transporter n=1 Tax=Streptomyces hygroscopicus TaxID=1912 RepID=UPI002240462B|nr:MFS transporter [Streptomyces hygroscopicus]